MKKSLLYPLAFSLLFLTLLLFQTCKKANLSPTSHFTITPDKGNTNTTFHFDASGCTDNEDPTHMLEVRWDFEGDGIWDTDWSTSKTSDKKYEAFSQHAPTLEVRDSDGQSHTKTITLLVVNGDTSSFTDPRDGKVYKIVTIGTQTWFAENLNYDTAGATYYNDDPALGAVYGRLYNWEYSQAVCPPGWHLPSYNEWNTFIDFLGSDLGGKLKEPGFEHWSSKNTDATNESGFTALPGGAWMFREYGVPAEYFGLHEAACFWSYVPPYMQSGYLITDDGQFAIWIYSNYDRCSIRCIKD